MNSIFGRINFGNNPISQSIFNKSIEELAVFENIRKESFIENNYGFGQIIFPPFKEAPIKSQNLIIVSDSILYNKIELSKELQFYENQTSDNLFILKSFEKWGKDCVNYLIGDFAFAIWNSETKELFCARDHFGVKPFNYYLDENAFVFSTDITGILAQEELNFSLDEQYIADSISIVKSEKSRTTYREIKKLPPAHCLVLKQNQLEIKSYWELKVQNSIPKKDNDTINEFKSLLIESVKCRTDERSVIGAELSGGIDSSSITAIASEHCQLKTFSHVLPDALLGKIHPFKDERDFINLLGDFCKIPDRHFITSEESLVKVIEENVANSKSLMQQNFGVFSDQLYLTAMQEGVSVLLSGFGGDEVITSKSSGYLNELAINKQWNDLKLDLKNQHRNKLKYAKSLLKIYLKSKLPLSTKIISLLKLEKPWWLSKFENLAMNQSFAKKLDIKNHYFKYYRKPQTFSLQEKNIERVTHPHVSQRLEYCSLIARKYGIEYRYPFLDKRLIECYLALPTRLKARNGIGRYAIRKAIEGIVPEKIQWRNDKSGATIPTVFMRMIKDKEEILEIIHHAKSNNLITKYIDLDQYEKWFLSFCKRSEVKQKNINPGAFYNYLKLILFIEQNPSLFK
jgi:asparagine synthase (glutamine-hydrolysing)